MPSDYTVEEVKPAEQWSNEHGRFQPYDLKLSGIEGTAQINRKLKDGAVPEDKIPKPGQSLYLSLTSTDYGFKAKEEQRQEGQQAMPPQTQSNGGLVRDDGNDPTRASIERQVAAKCAAQLISPGVKVPAAKRSEFAEWVHFLVDTFYDAISDPTPATLGSAPKSDEDIPF